ncbi:MAG: type II secretion system protein GspD, partial [Pirellulales bacterium]
VEPFALNLSLIIRQTEGVHEQIADLLTQLRRLLDLQLTIEVRFITLSDDFFERIGIDFDFDINDNTDQPFQVFGRPDPGFTPTFSDDGVVVNPGRDLQDRDHHRDDTLVGLSAPGVFSSDLDIPFVQDSFAAATPVFGGFNPAVGASIGFAILSDIEAFLFLNAATADNRTNVMQAPKVTLFNGQFATIFELTTRFFVLGQVPIVGTAAVGFQPIITPFPEGTFLSVNGVISADRRFVRVTVFPFFFQIRGFTTVTQTGGVAGNIGGGVGGGGGGADGIAAPITIQLPEIATTSVQTTVSVPDGGTILLGGIKRLSEDRREAGVPILMKIPYINRLFKNVGIGRSTTSLMLMVTPRIIIQEEEEQLLGLGGTS